MGYRMKKVQYWGADRSIHITIDVHADYLTKDEEKALIEGLADDAMLSMNRARYVHAPLSKIKVSSPRQ